jgi:O-succinylbenzoic acid--CoA ligase
MDETLLISERFWSDPAPCAPGTDFAVPQLCGLESGVLFQTSASTGPAKWIVLGKDALLVSARAVNALLDVDRASVWALALPLRHVGGFGVVARVRAAGCSFAAFAGKWDPLSFHAWLGKSCATHLSLVPTQLHDLASLGLRSPKRLRAVVVGGGALPFALGEKARALGWPVLASYGMTEAASQIATASPALPASLVSGAPLPLLPIWKVRNDSDGRLEISGPALFRGTLHEEPSGWCFTPRVGEWHPTNDLVRIEPAGLVPLGRADTMVKILGELVDPLAVESALCDLSGTALAPGSFCVVAVPDPRAGHRLVPVFPAGTDPSLIRSLLTEWERRGPGLSALTPPILLADFPRGPLGKPLRHEVLERIAPGVGGGK